jgi:DNA-binding LytR/AlgR family response regulator
MIDSAAPGRVLTCVIVDDEPLATAVLGRYCAQLSFLQVVATFHNSLAALAFLQTTVVDIVLLDIDMPPTTTMPCKATSWAWPITCSNPLPFRALCRP